MAQMEEASLLRQLNCAHIDSSAYLPASAGNSNGHVTRTDLHLRLTDVQKSRQELGHYSFNSYFLESWVLFFDSMSLVNLACGLNNGFWLGAVCVFLNQGQFFALGLVLIVSN